MCFSFPLHSIGHSTPPYSFTRPTSQQIEWTTLPTRIHTHLLAHIYIWLPNTQCKHGSHIVWLLQTHKGIDLVRMCIWIAHSVSLWFGLSASPFPFHTHARSLSHIPNKSLFNSKLLCFYCYCPFVIHFSLSFPLLLPLPLPPLPVLQAVVISYYGSCCRFWYCVRSYAFVREFQQKKNFLYKVIALCVRARVCHCVQFSSIGIFYSLFSIVNDRFYEKIRYKIVTHITAVGKSIVLFVRWFGGNQERQRQRQRKRVCECVNWLMILPEFSTFIVTNWSIFSLTSYVVHFMFVWERNEKNFGNDKNAVPISIFNLWLNIFCPALSVWVSYHPNSGFSLSYTDA